jgi:hypothetical protein
MNLSEKHIKEIIGIGAIAFFFLHSLTDLIEILNNGFSNPQLILTYISFIFIPMIIIGMFSINWKKAGWIGLIGTILYSISFIYFASTAIYPLMNKTRDYEILLTELGFIYYFHGGMMVVGGMLLGISIIKGNFYPLWTGFGLTVGVIINALVSFLPISAIFQTIGTLFRNISFIGIGIFIIKNCSKNNE